jgi:hypothetical protein
VIGMVDDREVLLDQVDDTSTGPQARAIAGGFRPRDDQARESTALPGAELGRSTGGPPGAQAGAALSSVCLLPSSDGAPINPEAIRHRMHGDVALKQFTSHGGATISKLRISRRRSASKWSQMASVCQSAVTAQPERRC